MVHKRFCRMLLVAGISGLVTASVATAQPNLLGNPSFEDPFVPDGPPFVGNWEPFNAGPGSGSFQATVMPRTGLAHLELFIDNTPNSFAGAFQDVPGLTPGETGTFSGWHATPSNPLDVGIEFRIEWRDSVNNVEISRTPNMTLAPTANYTMFTLSDTVPAGADTARVVYAIQTFGGGPTSTGTVYVDDASFVPEPTSLSLLALSAIALIRRR